MRTTTDEQKKSEKFIRSYRNNNNGEPEAAGDLQDLEWEDFGDQSNSQNNDFENRDLNYANMTDRQFTFVNITSSNFRYANFTLANMVGINVFNSDFHGACMKYAELEFSDWYHVNLNAADLSNVAFEGSTFSECDLSWANLRGADLSDCKFTNTKFHDAIIDSDTKLPFSRSEAHKLGMVETHNMDMAG